MKVPLTEGSSLPTIRAAAPLETISHSFSTDCEGSGCVVTDCARYRLDAASDGWGVVTWRTVRPGPTH